ncbi:acyclic terpene utilization AtuA family protein [Cupriavidus oxalaticus]|uniref:Acyclic terpene utilization AtuA family protein n=1 Tax=Cupriavidus oxalaticus TaxID=96344 RepID=A0A4P7LKV1_9BURK|nr:acyclic terpene utilization AtuA family protein [Cupriavidus oxalaticus]QBY56188.1 acyclic terpene utilization AtuA family protein [Cupriavidus oxalaticus]
MNECRFIAASGMLGIGVPEDSLRKALEIKPHFVAADAGTTDAGPFALGKGVCAFPREAILRDMTILLRNTVPAKIPLLIGSVGTGGADVHVDWFMEIVREVATAEGLQLRVAEIRSEQSKDFLRQKFREGRIRALDPAPHFDESTIERSVRIVGMMGVEPLQAALETGVDLVVAGRCSDPALFAAMPIMMGLPHGLAWHAGKVVECGASVCEKPSHGMIVGYVRPDEVVIQPIGPGLRCTPQTVAAHSLYENADPFFFTEASGVLDISGTTYEQMEDDISVRMRGSRFRAADQITIKLEGAELVGYQSILIGGIRDPFILGEFDAWLGRVQLRVRESVEKVFGRSLEALNARIDYHAYGRNGVMGNLEADRAHVPHEVGLVVEATASDQKTATALVQLTRQPLLHQPTTKWKGSITGFACLHNPSHIERGPVYTFNVNHVVLPESPVSMFRTTFTNIEGAAHATV